jgi:hypothetical protein
MPAKQRVTRLPHEHGKGLRSDAYPDEASHDGGARSIQRELETALLPMVWSGESVMTTSSGAIPAPHTPAALRSYAHRGLRPSGETCVQTQKRPSKLVAASRAFAVVSDCLDGSHTLRGGTLLALHDIELNTLAFCQGLESVAYDAGVMDEYVLRLTVDRNETITLRIVEPLDYTLLRFHNYS